MPLILSRVSRHLQNMISKGCPVTTLTKSSSLCTSSWFHQVSRAIWQQWSRDAANSIIRSLLVVSNPRTTRTCLCADAQCSQEGLSCGKYLQLFSSNHRLCPEVQALSLRREKRSDRCDKAKKE